jgi:hypothetical protein
LAESSNGGREDQHLARTVVTEVIVACLYFDVLVSSGNRLSPLRLLGEEIVGEPTVSWPSSASFRMTA